MRRARVEVTRMSRHRKTNDVRVARQGLSPLSGLITSRKCVTPSAVTAQSSRSKVVAGGLKLIPAAAVPGMSFRHRKKDSTGVPGFEVLPAPRLPGGCVGSSAGRRRQGSGSAHPAHRRSSDCSRSPLGVEDKINGMVGSLGSHLHGGDRGDVDLARVGTGFAELA